MSLTVLVTGGAGYVGSHTCKALAAAGYDPVTLDSLVHGHEAAVRWGPFERGDIGDFDRVREIVRRYRVEAVMHFAAFAYVGESISKPAKYFDNNVARTLRLLEAMSAEGVRNVVFSSTCAVYGIPTYTPIDEAHPQFPANPYGESKLFVEKALHWFGSASGLRYVSLRYFNAAGADLEGELGEDHDPETHLIPLAIRAATRRGGPLEIYGTDYNTEDGTPVRDYVHVNDLARAHVSALQHLQAGKESIALNLGTGQGHSVRAIVAEVERVSGCTVRYFEGTRRPGDPPILVADPDAAAKVLGWRASCSDLSTIVESAWQWETRADPLNSNSVT